jgi:hypothetical protein
MSPKSILSSLQRKVAAFNPRRFDDLVEQIAKTPADGHAIVDTGSSAFVPLVHYVMTNDMPAVLSQMGHTVSREPTKHRPLSTVSAPNAAARFRNTRDSGVKNGNLGNFPGRSVVIWTTA